MKYACIWSIAITLLITWQPLVADVLVTKSGRRYEGEVTETDKGYEIQRGDGQAISLPKSLVKEVLAAGPARETYADYLKKADLSNRKHVQILIDFTNEWGLVKERERLLEQVFEDRWEVVKDDRAKLGGLATWASSNGMKEHADRCVSQARDIQYVEQLKEVKDDGPELINLARWCREHGLLERQQEAEALALKVAPNDPNVRETLNYERDPATGGWRKIKTPWRVNVVSAVINDSYSEPLGLDSIGYTPAGKKKLAIVNVEFECVSADSKPLNERLKPLSEFLNDEAVTFMSGKKSEINAGDFLDDRANALVKKPTRLLMSTDVELQFGEDDRARVGFTSLPGGIGASVTGDTLSISFVQSKDPDVVRYVRAEGITALLVQPNRKVTLKLMFPVSPSLREAQLKFCDHRPLAVKF